MKFCRIAAGVMFAAVTLGLASAPALATEPDPLDNVKAGEPGLPTCQEPVFNIGATIVDLEQPAPDVVTLQQEVDGQWQPLVGVDFFDRSDPNNLGKGIVNVPFEFEPGDSRTVRLIAHALGSEGPTIWGPESVSIDCTDVTPTQTATPPSRPSADDVRDVAEEVVEELREQQTATPTQGVTEEATSTPTPTSTQAPTTTTIVTGPVVETDIPGPQGPSVAELVGSFFALALALGMVALQASGWGVKKRR